MKILRDHELIEFTDEAIYIGGISSTQESGILIQL